MGNHVRSVGLPFGVDIDFLLQSIQVYVARDVLIVLDRNGSRIECISQGIFVLHPVSPYICAIVATCSETDGFEEIKKYRLGAAISITGVFKRTPDQKQPFEVALSSSTLIGDVDESYPLQKKKTSFEFLRSIPHLRPRTNTFNAVFRVRSVLSFAIHEFFQGEGFVYVHTPLITSNDCEGAGETFKVMSSIDKPLEFFGKNANLTVSGQLHVEPFALTFRDVYTFGPTFRAEKSNTKNHAAEFWMIEPEISFADLSDDMDLAEEMIKYIFSYVLEHCPEEMEFFNQFVDNTLLERLHNVVTSDFARITYTDAVKELEKHNDEFEFKVSWGIDLQTEHERYLCEKIFNKPVFVTDYPKDIKAFYMKLNPDGKTVAAADLLAPGIGEIIGGSQREEDYDKLINRMQELKIDSSSMDWYLNLRKYGGCVHSGFGMGFERLLIYLTGVDNIRDVIPYPRTPKNCDF